MDEIQLAPVLVLNVYKTALNGREFLVGDAIILTEGVLHGSKGALFYPSDEIRQRPGVWNGMPITANHPMKGERAWSARTPEMWGQYQVGVFFNDDYSPETKSRFGKVWVDVELANRVDNRIVPRMLTGEPINVSTGLLTTDIPAPPTSHHKGKNYSFTARNYQPDHLAILLDHKGACSVEDGCGINVERLRTALPAVLAYNRDWSTEDRNKLDPDDFAGPQKSFPIKSQDDVNSAAKLFGHADDPDMVKGKIISLAKKKGLSIPQSWVANGKYSNAPEKCVHCGAMHETDPDSGICNRCGKQNPASSNTENAMKCPKCGKDMEKGGTCSCGYKDTTNNARATNVSWLTTNCGHWKGKDVVLNDEKSFTDAEVEAFKTNAEAQTLAINTLKGVSEAIKAPATTSVADLPKLVANAITTPVSPPPPPPPPNPNPTPTPTMNKDQFAAGIKEFFGGMSAADKLQLIGDPTLNELAASAKTIVEDKRSEVINQLTSHIEDEPTRNQLVEKLKKEKTETLNVMLQVNNARGDTPNPTPGGTTLAAFFQTGGAAVIPTTNTQDPPVQNRGKSQVSRTNVLRPSLPLEDEAA